MTVFLFQSSSRTTGVISNMYWFRILKKEKKAYLVQIFFFRGQHSESKQQDNSYKLGFQILNYRSTIGVVVTSFIENCFPCDLS